MSRVDRSRLPVPGPDRRVSFPAHRARTLANGLEMRAVTHHSVPVAAIALLVPGGSSVDPPDRQGWRRSRRACWTRAAAASRRSRLPIVSRGSAAIWTSISAPTPSSCRSPRSIVSSSEGLALVHEIVAEPNLAADDFNRIRNLRLERLRQMKDHAGAMAERAFARVLYQDRMRTAICRSGPSRRRALPPSTKCARYHAALFVPAGATIVIVGDRPEEELLDAAAVVFAAWQPRRSDVVVDRAAPAGPAARIACRPAGRGAARRRRRSRSSGSATCRRRRSTPDYHALVMLNTILGGQFVSRANLNLREDKGYTYGVRTGFDLRLGRGSFVFQTSVGTDVTMPAIRDALAEIRDIASSRPATDRRVVARVHDAEQGLPARFRDCHAGGAIRRAAGSSRPARHVFRRVRATAVADHAPPKSAGSRGSISTFRK